MKELFELHELSVKLKNLKRAGWQLKDVPDPESVAEHSFSVSLLVLMLAERLKLDSGKCTRMALVHDLAEAAVGDITPHDDISLEEKAGREKKAVDGIARSTNIGLMGLWKEFEENKSKEANLVHDMDKIEMLLQALDYEKRYDKDLGEFFEYVKPRLVLADSKKMFAEILKRRQG